MTTAKHAVSATQAASWDLAALDDPIGLQRAALESVCEGGVDQVRRNRHVAGQCRDAVELRRFFDEQDAVFGPMFGR